ncbi:MAG: FAD-dependent oxidoreductase [Solirubrobacterales bacterium]|nr:FAD-dependent oxidoreductase [Solirubrobacterales bacterium]
MRAIVVGAGLAGLAAAGELQRAGAEVEVFEARDRVGGRVWSVPFAGAVAERGAEFIFPEHEEMIAAAERLGLRLVPKGMLYGDREPRGGEPVARAEVVAAVERIRAQAPGGETVAEALAQYGLEPRVLEAIQARLEVSCAYTAADLDAEALVEGAGAFGPFDTYGVAGGNGRLAQEMAGRLDDPVRLSTPVTKISWSEGEVRVVDRAGRESGGEVGIIAVPAAVSGAIECDPPLPAAKRSAWQSVRYGQAAKLFVALREPAPPSATLSVPERFWCYTQLDPDGEPLSFVTAFAGTLQALE